MKIIRKAAISLALVLLTTPLISAQELSRYRKFALGTSLAALSKQIGQDPHQATLIHQSPAVIKELQYWPVETSYSAVPAEPVSQISFSFYNGELYRIAVTYDQNAIEGMTEDDMVRAVSARYGTWTRLYPASTFLLTIRTCRRRKSSPAGKTRRARWSFFVPTVGSLASWCFPNGWMLRRRLPSLNP